MGRGGAWLDTGSIEDFYKTSAFVSAIENRQGFKIACLEEIAFNNKWIGKKEILDATQFYGKCEYSNYLKINFLNENKKTKFKGLMILNGIKHQDKRGYLRELVLEKLIKKNLNFKYYLYQKKMF